MAESPAAPEMQARHFVFIAGVLAERRPPVSAPAWVRWAADVDAFADALEVANAGFKRARFLKACGLEDGQ